MRTSRLANVFSIGGLVLSLAIIFIGNVSLGQSDSATANEIDEGTTIPFALPRSGPFNPAEIDIDNDKAISMALLERRPASSTVRSMSEASWIAEPVTMPD